MPLARSLPPFLFAVAGTEELCDFLVRGGVPLHVLNSDWELETAVSGDVLNCVGARARTAIKSSKEIGQVDSNGVSTRLDTLIERSED